MALQARRFHGKPLLQPTYNFRDVPYCSPDLSGSTISIVTERQHLVNSIAELTLLCSEAARRKSSSKKGNSLDAPTKKTAKPLSIEYIFDRIDTDDPMWGIMVRTDTPMSIKGRVSNMKSSPNWKRGMLQGFITMTTFTNWQSTFRFDSLHEMAFGQDDDDLEDQMKAGMRVFDEDGTFAEELETSVKGGNPHLEGLVYPKIAEVSLFGGLGCGKQLLRLLVEHLECLKATARANYDYIILQATENSIPFYEAMGFTRVGCVTGKAASPDAYHSSPVEEYHAKKNGETPYTIAKEFGVDPWEIVFLNRPLYPELVQKSWLKLGTTIFVPKVQSQSNKVSSAKGAVAKWYCAEENETPRGIAKKFQLNFADFIEANKRRYPDLVGHSKLMEGTRIQISRFDIDEGDTIAYSHWTFPDADQEDNEPSYMMAMKLNRKKGVDMKSRPMADSLAVPIQEYSPVVTGAQDLLVEPTVAPAPLAPVFTSKTALKEPKKPKRPKTSYTYFTLDLRASMEDEFEGKPFEEINRFIAEKWRALSDEEKIPYQEQYEESKAEYVKLMKKYEAAMRHFKRQGPQDTTQLAKEVDTSLLEKVVKLKSANGISGASKSGYYYVLTFIPDLQWVHLIPMRKVGIFSLESGPDSCGRPIWMIVGEDEGKEIDTTAAVCQPVTALAMNDSADADNEQWDIYDNSDKPPPPPPSHAPPISTSKTSSKALPRSSFTPKYHSGSQTKRGRPRINYAESDTDDTPIPSRKRGRPSLSKPKAAAQVFSSKSDPAALGKLLSSLKDDSGKSPSAKDIVLSLHDPTYKEIMWEQFNILGPDRDKVREIEVCDEVFTLFKQNMRKRGTFFKSVGGGNIIEVDDAVAREKILRDLRRRVETTNNWLIKDAVHKKVVKKAVAKKAVAKKAVAKKAVAKQAVAKNTIVHKGAVNKDVVLSTLNDDYRIIMWSNFQKLGKQPSAKEEAVASKILETLKKNIGKGGRFFKKEVRSNELYEVGEEVALIKIVRDIKRRNESRDKWTAWSPKKENVALSRPSLTPTKSTTKKKKCSASSGPTLTPTRKKKSSRPQADVSPSRYPRRGSQPESYPPDIIDRVTPKPPSHSKQKEDGKKKQPALASIFLKSYKKKKANLPTDDSLPAQSPERERRYPGRKRKQVIDDSHLVSDEDYPIEPRRKKSKSHH